MPTEAIHLAICVPSDDDVRADFAFALAGLFQATALDPPQGMNRISLHNMRSSVLPGGRQRIAEEALKVDATHLLWIDSDMFFPARAAHELLKWKRPIVGINARQRRPPFRLTAQSAPGVALETNNESRGIEKCYRCGFGMLMVEARVFREIGSPYFGNPWLEEKNCFGGEDYFFCHKVQDKGFEVWIDHDLSKRVAHVATYGLTCCQELLGDDNAKA
jgi:hypothetical protein